MKRNAMVMSVMLALAAGLTVAAIHRVDPRVNLSAPDRKLTGEESAQFDPNWRPDPVYNTSAVDTIGNVYRAGVTWYEGQSNGTIGRMIELDDSNNVHVVWMRGVDSAAVSRQIYYNMLLANGQWAFGANGTQVPPQVISRSGFVSMGMYAGLPFPSFHENNPRITGSATSSNTYHDIEAGVGAFIADQPMSTVTEAGAHVQAIWPRIQVGRNGRVHVVLSQNSATAGAAQNQYYVRGVYDAMQTTVTWSAPVQLPGVTHNIAAEVAASRHTNRAAVAWMRPHYVDSTGLTSSQVANNVVAVISNDGDTWNFNNMQYVSRWRHPNAALLPDTAAANGDTFRAYNDINMLFTRTGVNSDMLHAAFTTGLFYRWDTHQNDSTGATVFADSSFYVWGHIWHWREDDPDRITMVANGGNYWTDIYANPGAWNRTVHRPNMSEASNGDLYVTFAGHSDPRDTTMAQDVSLAGECNYDIFITKSVDGGYHWAYPTNVTHTRTPDAAAGACLSEHWPSSNRWVDQYVHITYVTDRDAGFILQSEGSWTLNDFNYQRVPVSSIPATPELPYRQIAFSAPEPIESGSLPVDFAIEKNYPNPFNPTTEIVFSLNSATSVKLAVYDIQGRLVANLSEGRLSAGQYRVNFDGHDLSSGVYFARMTAGNRTVTHKMTLLK